MESSLLMLVVTVLALLLLESSLRTDARLLHNDLFFRSGNPSAFHQELNSVVGKTDMAANPHPVEKIALPCGVAELQPWKSSPQTFKEDRTGSDSKEESAGAEEVVYNVLPKGRTTPSGPSPIGNVVVNEERLAKSGHSPGVGHMQVFNTPKTRQSEGGGHMQDDGNKRILKSTPSPGDGHLTNFTWPGMFRRM